MALATRGRMHKVVSLTRALQEFKEVRDQMVDFFVGLEASDEEVTLLKTELRELEEGFADHPHRAFWIAALPCAVMEVRSILWMVARDLPGGDDAETNELLGDRTLQVTALCNDLELALRVLLTAVLCEADAEEEELETDEGDPEDEDDRLPGTVDGVLEVGGMAALDFDDPQV